MTEQLSTYTRCTGVGCRRLMLWCVTVGGKRMPLDPDPHADGNVVITRMPSGEIRGRVLTGGDLPAVGLAYRPHHRTCIAAADFRRRKAATGPKCRACSGELSIAMADAGERYHVNCAPSPDVRQHYEEARSTAPAVAVVEVEAPAALPGLEEWGKE